MFVFILSAPSSLRSAKDINVPTQMPLRVVPALGFTVQLTYGEMSVCIDSSASKVMPVKEKVLFSNDAMA